MASHLPTVPIVRLLSAKDISQRLQVNNRTLWRMVARGDFPRAAIRRGEKFVRWTEAQWIEWLSKPAS